MDRLRAHLNTAFPEALIHDYEHMIPFMTNHEGDKHVLAAAVVGRADAIVTWNVHHFPPLACEPFGIVVQTPDAFLCGLHEENPDLMATIVDEQAAHLRNPRLTTQELLAVLSKLVPDFSSRILAAKLD